MLSEDAIERMFLYYLSLICEAGACQQLTPWVVPYKKLLRKLRQ
jgi:hypothetical protein